MVSTIVSVVVTVFATQWKYAKAIANRATNIEFANTDHELTKTRWLLNMAVKHAALPPEYIVERGSFRVWDDDGKLISDEQGRPVK